MARKVIKSVSLGSNARDDLNAMFTELYSNLGIVGVTASAAELNILDNCTATTAELNYLDITTLGTGAPSKAVVLDANSDWSAPTNSIIKIFQLKDADDNLLSTNFESVNSQCDVSLQQLTVGTGFAGTGTIYKTGVRATGAIKKTEIMIDLTGTASVATDLDIIGTHATNPAHIGQLTTALTGATYLMGKVTCLEVPIGGAVDIDLYSADEGTGAKDTGIGTLVETALVTADGNWTLGLEKAFTGIPTAGQYLYLTSGTATAGTYSAGKLLIEIWGY